MHVLKNFLFPKINFKRAIIRAKTYSHLVNTDWLITATLQAVTTLGAMTTIILVLAT